MILIISSLAGGVFLILNKTIGIQVSLINYYLQVVNFNAGDNLNFRYDNGIFFNLGITPSTIDLEFELGLKSVFIFMNKLSSSPMISINVIAIIIIYYLMTHSKDLPESE